MPVDPERASAIENSLVRTLRFAVEELSQSPDRAASKLGQANTQLDSSDAREHLSAETIAKFRAQIADMQKQIDDAERAETAARIERDVRRYLTNLDNEISSRGSQIDSCIERADARLAKDDVVKALTPETIATLQRELDGLRAKVGGPPPAAVATIATPPAPTISSTPTVSSVPPVPPATPVPPVSPVSSPPPPTASSEEADRIASSIARTLRSAAGEITSPAWRRIEGQIGQAATQIESDQARQLLPAATLDSFRAQLTTLQAQFAQNDRAEKIEEIEDWVRRLLTDAENHIDWADRIGGMLAKVTEVLEAEKTRTYLPGERAEFFRKEIARIETAAGGTQRNKTIEDATAPLEELEQRITDSSFDALDEYECQKLWGEFEALKDRAGYALDRLPSDDPTARELRTRVDAAIARRAAAYAATTHTATMARVTTAWKEALGKVAGYEDEAQDTSAPSLDTDFMPKTREAVRVLRDTLAGSSLFSPIPKAREEYPDDPALARIVADGEKLIDTAVARMAKAFDAIMDAAEQIPTPTRELEQRPASFMAEKARDAFQGTSYEEPRVERVAALLAFWENTLALAKELTEAYYAERTKEADAAWPAIASAIEAEDGFNPSEPGWRGRTVRINGFYNRIGWDFTGDYHMATWVNDTPVAADFEPHVLEAFSTAVKHTRSAIDDHTPWDAILVVDGVGKLKHRTKTTVKKDGATIGELEEWLPVDCAKCRVIALRAGPVAVGPA